MCPILPFFPLDTMNKMTMRTGLRLAEDMMTPATPGNRSLGTGNKGDCVSK